MDLEYLRRDCGSLGGQRRAIAGLTDDVCRTVSAAAATAFGVIPLAELDGVLALGAVPGIHPDCAEALARALERRVALIEFDDGVVREAIAQRYLRQRDASQGLDLATFDSPDFLRDAAAVRALMAEKQGVLPERKIVVPRGRVALIELRAHSVLRSLDRRRRIEFAQTPSQIPFRIVDDGALLFRERAPQPAVRAIVSQSLFYDGDEHLHVLSGQDLTKLPHVLHPSELQLAELEGDEARFWVYDALQSVRVAPAPGPGPLASWTCRYFFLHFGARFMRTLRLDVLSFALVERAKLRIAARTDRLAPSDLTRLFGLDFPRLETADRAR